MKDYKKVIILSVILLILISLITLFMTTNINLLFAKSLSITGIQEKKNSVENYIAQEKIEEANYTNAKTTLQTSKNQYDVAKSQYESIDESTKKIVSEATKEEQYFIEYLWVVLGNYASANKVEIDIITPGSTSKVETTESEENKEQTTNTSQQSTTNQTSSEVQPNNENDVQNVDANSQEKDNNSVSEEGKIQIVIKGRYANVADFVFDVENDKELRFKLDNIKMTYSGDNKITATFDVLKMNISK